MRYREVHLQEATVAAHQNHPKRHLLEGASERLFGSVLRYLTALRTWIEESYHSGLSKYENTNHRKLRSALWRSRPG